MQLSNKYDILEQNDTDDYHYVNDFLDNKEKNFANDLINKYAVCQINHDFDILDGNFIQVIGIYKMIMRKNKLSFYKKIDGSKYKEIAVFICDSNKKIEWKCVSIIIDFEELKTIIKTFAHLIIETSEHKKRRQEKYFSCYFRENGLGIQRSKKWKDLKPYGKIEFMGKINCKYYREVDNMHVKEELARLKFSKELTINYFEFKHCVSLHKVLSYGQTQILKNMSHHMPATEKSKQNLKNILSKYLYPNNSLDPLYNIITEYLIGF